MRGRKSRFVVRWTTVGEPPYLGSLTLNKCQWDTLSEIYIPGLLFEIESENEDGTILIVSAHGEPPRTPKSKVLYSKERAIRFARGIQGPISRCFEISEISPKRKVIHTWRLFPGMEDAEPFKPISSKEINALIQRLGKGK